MKIEVRAMHPRQFTSLIIEMCKKGAFIDDSCVGINQGKLLAQQLYVDNGSRIKESDYIKILDKEGVPQAPVAPKKEFVPRSRHAFSIMTLESINDEYNGSWKTKPQALRDLDALGMVLKEPTSDLKEGGSTTSQEDQENTTESLKSVQE